MHRLADPAPTLCGQYRYSVEVVGGATALSGSFECLLYTKQVGCELGKDWLARGGLLAMLGDG